MAIEFKKDAKKTEATITSLMEKNKLSLAAAEKRYREFLVDPDGFALCAGAARNKAEGYKNWEDAAVGRSKDQQATRERIDNFKKQSQLKALGVIAVFSAVLLRCINGLETLLLNVGAPSKLLQQFPSSQFRPPRPQITSVRPFFKYCFSHLRFPSLFPSRVRLAERALS